MINSVNVQEITFLEKLKKILEQIVKSLVNKPEHVHVEIESKPEGKHLLAINVDEKDLGKVIGKNGQTIKSIRALVYVINPGFRDIIVDVSM